MRFVLAKALVAMAALSLAAPVEVFAKGPESVAKLAAELSPAVVNIGTSKHIGGNGQEFPKAPEGSPLYDLFDDLNPNQGQGPEAE